MGCSEGTQSRLEKLRDALISLNDLTNKAIICTHQQQDIFLQVMKEIEVKCSLIKKQLFTINVELTVKEDIQGFENLNRSYQNNIVSLNKKIQGK